MILFFDQETLKITAISTARTLDNTPLPEELKNDVIIEEPALPIVAQKIDDDDIILKVWQAMDSIAEQCNVVLNENKKVIDIVMAPLNTGEDR